MTSDAVSPRKRDQESGRQLSPEQAAAAAMVAEARARGLELTGPSGLLKLFTKNVLETALNEELTEHLGHSKHQAEPGRESTNVRNGSRSKTVISYAAGEVVVDVPRDREGTFEPQIVKKRQRRLTDVDEIVLSLYAKGPTTGEISAHFAEIYGASVSRETISRITDTVIAEMQDWAARPLDGVYVAVFIDPIMVKVRDGQVANRPVYAAIGVTVDGGKDVLGLWMGVGGEGAKFLDERAHRPAQSRRAGRVLPGLRRAEGPARRGRARVAPGRGADLHYSSHPQHLSAGLSRRPRRDQTRRGISRPSRLR
jgi:putative transposase